MVTLTTFQAREIASWLRRGSPQGDDDRRALVAMVELLEAKAAEDRTLFANTSTSGFVKIVHRSWVDREAEA